MTLKPMLKLVGLSQLAGLTLTLLILLADWRLALTPERAQTLGGNLTVLLLILGVFSHIAAKRGRVPPGLIALLAAFPPVYAYLHGTWRHIIGFHVAVLAFHGFILWNTAIRAKEAAEAGKVTDASNHHSQGPPP